MNMDLFFQGHRRPKVTVAHERSRENFYQWFIVAMNIYTCTCYHYATFDLLKSMTKFQENDGI